MTCVQGDNATYVLVSENGQIVKFYNNDKKFIYYADKNETVEVKDYKKIDSVFKEYSLCFLSFDDVNMIDGSEMTYMDKDGNYIAVVIDYDNVDETGILKYKNLHIVRMVDSMRMEYTIFE